MFDVGWSELLLIASIAIVVVGPKDLPKLMLQMGRWSRAAQRAAREFRASLEQLAEEAEAKDAVRELRQIGEETKTGLADPVADPYPAAVDPTGPSPPPPAITLLPPEGGSFRPPTEDDERPASAAQAGGGS